MDSVEGFTDLQYVRTMGAYKPHFEGIPDSYYPLNKRQVCYYALIVLLTICATLGLMIGFMRWALVSFYSYINAVTALMLLVIVVGITLLYFGGKERIRLERKLIVDAELAQQEAIKQQKSL